MKDIGAILLIGVIAIALMFGVSSCVKWKWSECRKVGHGKLYCLDKVLRDK